MDVNSALNAIGLRYQSQQTVLVVSPKIFNELEINLSDPQYVIFPPSTSAPNSWKGITISHGIVFADSTVPDNQVNVFTKGGAQSISTLLGNNVNFVSSSASFP